MIVPHEIRVKKNTASALLSNYLSDTFTNSSREGRAACSIVAAVAPFGHPKAHPTAQLGKLLLHMLANVPIRAYTANQKHITHPVLLRPITQNPRERLRQRVLHAQR